MNLTGFFFSDFQYLFWWKQILKIPNIIPIIQKMKENIYIFKNIRIFAEKTFFMLWYFMNGKKISYCSTLLPFGDKQNIQSCNSHQRRERNISWNGVWSIVRMPRWDYCQQWDVVFSGVVTWLSVSLRQSQNLNKMNSIVLFYLGNSIYKQIIRYICFWMKIIMLIQNGVLTYE